MKLLGLQLMWVRAAPPPWAGFYKEKAPVIAFNEDLDPAQVPVDRPVLPLHGCSVGMILVLPEQLFCAWLSLNEISCIPKCYSASALQPAAHNPVPKVTLALVMAG